MGSYLVIGMGVFGGSVAMELCRMKNDVLVVDKHEDNVAGIVDKVTDAIIGDSTDEAVLRSLGIQSFDCVVVAIGRIEDSILTALTLKEMGVKKLVCKAQNERHTKILVQIGADDVINPESDMGKRVARSLVHPNIVDYLEILPDYGIIELLVPERWIGKSIVQIDLRKKYGVTLIAIRRIENGTAKFLPDADMMLREDDILTLLGSKRNLERISDLHSKSSLNHFAE